VDSKGKIYIVSSAQNGSPGIVRTYDPNGKPTTPTFKAGPDSSAIAVDENGKIYVANAGPRKSSSVTTYNPDGTPTLPTITSKIRQPAAVAVGADGTIYVANATNQGPDGTLAGYVTTYAPDGTGPLLLFKNGTGYPAGIATDAMGKIYVASTSAYRSLVRTHTPGGTKTTPTIGKGLNTPSAIVIH
jgi:sugar lactone lactonase YvrE